MVLDLPATEDKNADTNHCMKFNIPHTSSTSRSQNTSATSAETHAHQCTYFDVVHTVSLANTRTAVPVVSARPLHKTRCVVQHVHLVE
eukprot:481652-Amphidinium_carterae.1